MTTDIQAVTMTHRICQHFCKPRRCRDAPVPHDAEVSAGLLYCNEVKDGLGDELRSIIRPDMPGDAPQDEEVR